MATGNRWGNAALGSLHIFYDIFMYVRWGPDPVLVLLTNVTVPTFVACCAPGLCLRPRVFEILNFLDPLQGMVFPIELVLDINYCCQTKASSLLAHMHFGIPGW